MPTTTKRHRFFGYQGKGVYGCECGWTIKTVHGGAIAVRSGTHHWLTDQWNAHRRGTNGTSAV